MNQNLTIPLAIVIAGALVGAGFFFTRSSDTQAPNANNPAQQQENTQYVPPVSADDHILGNPEASVIIVEYSDTECPFCKDFHATMHRIIDEYGKDGDVAWVYRHFPIEQIHSKAPKEAEATECAAELGGNDTFWAYIDRVFEVTPSNNGLPLSQLPEIAEEVDLDRAEFEQCLNSGRHAQTVDAHFQQARDAGARGTPFNVIIAQGQQFTVEGAQPYSAMKQAVDALLAPAGNPTHQAVPSVTQ